MKTAGIVVLVFALFVDKGATCSVSSPQCYKNTTQPDDDFLCEWQDRDPSPNAIYTIFMKTSSVNESSYANQFTAGKKWSKLIPVENLITTRFLDIWVLRQEFDVKCSSTPVSVILDQSVKYSPPNLQKKMRSAEKLLLSWPRMSDHKGAVHEIRWKKKDDDAWQNKTLMTEDGRKNGDWDSHTMQLQENCAYQVQIRRKAKQSLLWSDWSQISNIPTEIPQPVVLWTEKTHRGKREIRLRWNYPPPESSFGGIFYNLTMKLPCKRMKSHIIRNNTMKFVVSDSEARVTLEAVNNVGRSASQEILIPPVQHLPYCHNDSYSLPKHYCWEWYQLADGAKRTSRVINISRKNTLQDIKQEMQKYVRYYYFLHDTRKQQQHTVRACPVYSTQGVPSSPPKNVSVLNITQDSAVLRWSSIPVQDQHGFLIYYVIWVSKEGQTLTGHHHVAVNETIFHLRNLEAASSYTLSIAGGTKIGLGPNSTRTFFTRSNSSSDTEAAPGDDDLLPGMKTEIRSIVMVCAVVLVCSVALSFAVRRLRSKLFPIIPSPVISAAAVPQTDKQNMEPVSEVVDDVVLLRRDDRVKLGCSLKHLTSLQEVSPDKEEEDEDDEDDDDDDDDDKGGEGLLTASIFSDKPSFFPNPNYKVQTLGFPEFVEITDGVQRESCEVKTPAYKNGLFLGEVKFGP